MTLEQAIDEYLDYLAIERGSSPNTIEGYGRDLRRYAAYLAGLGITRPEDVTREAVAEHVKALQEVGLAPTSVERAVLSINARDVRRHATCERYGYVCIGSEGFHPYTLQHNIYVDRIRIVRLEAHPCVRRRLE